MCQYVEVNKCKITNINCPFMYFCNNVNDWRPMKSMPKRCKVQSNIEPPKGWSKVRMERHGKLYIDIEGQTIKLPNPFDYVPILVKVSKVKGGKWRIREGKVEV